MLSYCAGQFVNLTSLESSRKRLNKGFPRPCWLCAYLWGDFLEYINSGGKTAHGGTVPPPRQSTVSFICVERH